MLPIVGYPAGVNTDSSGKAISQLKPSTSMALGRVMSSVCYGPDEVVAISHALYGGSWVGAGGTCIDGPGSLRDIIQEHYRAGTCITPAVATYVICRATC